MRENGELVEMNERGYDTEDLLQGYLADHPDLLAGDQINDVEPRRWLLISREMGVPSEEDSGDRWSADHLFLDQDAIPTIVEVKRSTDTRARREVVAQMLDYAANGVMYWPLERLRSTFEANCRSRDHDPETTLLGSLGLELDPEEFWRRATTNFQAGKVRLIFVADKIPSELRRIVEFLNEQMNPAEVLAIEIKQHVAEDFKAKAPEAVKPARAIFEWATSKTSRIAWGKGKQYGTFSPTLDHGGIAHKPLQVWTGDYLYIQLGDMRATPPFDNEVNRLELLRRLNEVPGIVVPEKAVEKYPSVLLSPLNNEIALKQFLEVLDWFVQEVKAT